MTDLTTLTDLELDCLIAERLGWKHCRVQSRRAVEPPAAFGFNPNGPNAHALRGVPTYSTDPREVIAVRRERGWAVKVYPDVVKVGGGKPVTIRDNNHARAAAEALAGMLDNHPTDGGQASPPRAQRKTKEASCTNRRSGSSS